MLTEFELVNINPEVGTERSLKTARLLKLPEDTCVVYFHHFETIEFKMKSGQTNTTVKRIDEEMGYYYIENGKTHVGGHVVVGLHYYRPKNGGAALVWPNVDNMILAHQRFLLLVDQYKQRYNMSTWGYMKR